MNTRSGLSFAITCALAGACTADEPPVLKISRVEYSGCAEVSAGPRCRVSAGAGNKVRLWIAGGLPRGDLLPGGARVEELQGGVRYEVVIEPDARELAIRDGAHTLWSLALERSELDPHLLEARAALDRSQLDRAEQHARASPDQARALQLLARIAFRRERREEAIELHRRAAAAARQAGLTSVAADSSQAAIFLLTMSRKLDAAQAELENSRGLSGEYYDGRAGEFYYAGLLARELGDLRTALGELDRAAVLSARLGHERLEFLTEEMLSTTLVQVGLHREALERLARLTSALPEQTPPCTRAALLSNYGWAAAVAGSTLAEPLLQNALTLNRTACANPRNDANTSINLALVALERGRIGDADRYLHAAPAAEDVRLLLWQRELEGRIALARGETQDALAIFDELEQLAAASLALDASWRATLGRGRTFEQLGRTREAESAYRAAEEWLDRESKLVPLARGRDSFLQDREESLVRLTGLLLKQDHPERALAAVIHARQRESAELRWSFARGSEQDRRTWREMSGEYLIAREELEAEARSEWKLPPKIRETHRRERATRAQNIRARLFEVLDRAGGEIRPPPPPPARAKEATLVLQRIPGGAAAFWVPARGLIRVATSTSTSVSGASASAGEVAAARVLAAVDRQLADVSAIRISAPDVFRSVDFHALELGGRRLLERVPMVYGAATSSRAAAKHVLIVADPNEDLRHARTEAALAAAAMKKLGYGVELYEGTRALRSTVLSALSRSAVFHYAGHAELSEPSQWESALPLNDGRVSSADVFALERPPAVLVLSGCETAGIAEMFLAAGSRGAIATVRPIKDEEAAMMSRRLFELLAAEPSLIDDVGRWLQRAQLELASARPEGAWFTYRALGR